MPLPLDQGRSPENTSPFPHPGYLLSYNWFLEIYRKERKNTERITLAVNGFNLPERASETFNIRWGPGAPAITYPGPVAPFQFTLDITNFYARDIVEFLITWHENTLIDCLANFHDGAVIGRDDRHIIRYKANVYRMWPVSIRMGEMNRGDTTRQRISATLACYDIIHDFTFDKFEFEEL